MPSLASHVHESACALLPHQRRVILSRADYTVIHGGVGAAKTTACLWHVYLRCLMAPNQRIVIAALTQTMLDDVIVGPWHDEFDPATYHYVAGKAGKITVKCVYGGESIIYLRAMDAEFKIKRLKGLTITGYYFAQAEQLPEMAFTEAQKRLRGKKNRHLWFRLFDANASGTGHWLYRHILDAGSPSYVGSTGSRVDNIHVRSFDNPSAYSADDYATALRVLGQQLFDQEYNGVWGQLSGSMFTILDPPQDPEMRDKVSYHVRDDYPTGDGKWAVSIDYGYNFAAQLLYLQGPYVHVVDEVLLQDTRRDAQIAALRQLIQRNDNPPILGMAGDPAGTYPQSDGRTISANRDISNEFGWTVMTVNKARSDGWMQCIEFLGTEIGGRPRVTFSTKCVQTVRTGREMVWSDDQHRDSDSKCFDHLWDALRYALMSRLMQHGDN